MPPSIKKVGRYVSNYPAARPYVFAGSGWLTAEFGKFSFNAVGGASSMAVVFPAFSFDGTTTSNSFSAEFQPFTASFTAISGSVSSLNIEFPSFSAVFSGETTVVDATAIKISGAGICYQLNSVSVDASAIKISADGSISGSITIVTPPEESGDGDYAYSFTGDTYIVLNLKTAAHAEYRDGNNNALATTGELMFSSQHMKNVSDVHVLSRADEKVRVIVKSGENVERTHDITFNIDTDGNLKNKKLRLAKGLKATNWQLSVGSPDGDKAEIRSVDLVVNKLKRRV